MTDFDLQRFVDAQTAAWPAALAELRDGQKRSHWMWFIFPQLRGLGVSPTATFYGLESLAEARAYRAHPILGERLVVATQAVLDGPDRSLHAIFGSPDDLKFVSSMTLFAQAAAAPDTVFHQAIARKANGRMDARTLALLNSEQSPT